MGKIGKFHLMAENLLGMSNRQKIYVYENILGPGGCLPLPRGYIHVYDYNIKTSSSQAAPVAEWLRSLTSVLLIIRSSHHCGFAPRTGHESHVGQAKFCLRVCQVVFILGTPVFAPPTD